MTDVGSDTTSVRNTISTDISSGYGAVTSVSFGTKNSIRYAFITRGMSRGYVSPCRHITIIYDEGFRLVICPKDGHGVRTTRGYEAISYCTRARSISISCIYAFRYDVRSNMVW